MPLTELIMQNYSYSAMHYLRRTDEDDDFVLDAPYQRQSVWSLEQRRNLIRSLMLGIPIGSTTINDRSRADGSKYAIVDGRQRVETVRMWFDNQFGVPTDWWRDDELLTSRNEIGKLTHYRDLATVGIMRCKTHWKLPANETRLPASSEPGLYLLINFGGVAQTEDDRSRVEALVGEPL